MQMRGIIFRSFKRRSKQSATELHLQSRAAVEVYIDSYQCIYFYVFSKMYTELSSFNSLISLSFYLYVLKKFMTFIFENWTLRIEFICKKKNSLNIFSYLRVNLCLKDVGETTIIRFTALRYDIL